MTPDGELVKAGEPSFEAGSAEQVSHILSLGFIFGLLNFCNSEKFEDGKEGTEVGEWE